MEKKARLVAEGEKQSAGEQATSKKPVMLKYGLNHVTDLIEIKKAKLVVIAHDVVPIDLVCWLPALCRKKDVPYCIIKGKSRLGQLVHKKTCAVVAIDAVRKEVCAKVVCSGVLYYTDRFCQCRKVQDEMQLTQWLLGRADEQTLLIVFN